MVFVRIGWSDSRISLQRPQRKHILSGNRSLLALELELEALALFFRPEAHFGVEIEVIIRAGNANKHFLVEGDEPFLLDVIWIHELEVCGA